MSQCHSQYEGYIKELLRIDEVFNYHPPPCLRLALQGPSDRFVVAAEPIELSLAGQTDAWVTMSPQPCLLLALQGHSVRLVVAAEPIELSVAGQTDMRRGPGTCWYSWFTISHGQGATVTLDRYTNSRESFNPPVSRRAITHYEEDAIGLGVWGLDLELEHVVVARHHLQRGVSKRHDDNSVVELCTTDHGDEDFLET